ncbi:LuxR C-terminal-related transcriptional regulator [Dryocola sp. LX212]|jgi:LuxR family quorum-sensing system transcriptional regulator ExpR
MRDVFNLPDPVCDRIKGGIERILSQFPDIIYAYAIMDKRDPLRMVIFNNYPSWFNFYLEKKLQMIDPVIVKALKSVEDFSWDNNIKMPGAFRSSSIFKDSLMYNIGSGHTFVVHDYLDNLAILSLITKSSKDVNTLSSCVNIQSAFNSLHQKTLSYSAHTASSLSPLLSLREIEVLSWVSSGKTYAEVASILEISQRTVKFHVSNTMKKLGVHNARHAVRLCVEFGLLLPSG